MGFPSRALIAIWTVVLALDHARLLKAEDPARVRLVLIGDSTVKNGSGKGEGGLWGWGQVLADHFDLDRIEIENRALGGRSSRTYLTEGLWEKSLERLRPGDFVLMQFGHNDGGDKFKGNRPRASIKGNGEETVNGVVEISGKEEAVHSYGWYLRKYISDAKAKGATPVVLSLVPRDRWEAGRVIRSNRDYGKWASEAAEQEDALFIDLNEIVSLRYEEIGEKKVGQELFTQEDWTHTTRDGAEVNAACVVEGIKSLQDCSLKQYLLPSRTPAKVEQTSWKFECGSGMIAAGYDQVLPLTMYSQELGFGWGSGASVPCAEQESSNSVTQDVYLSDAHSINLTAMSRRSYPVSFSSSVIYFP
ncbi:rhamnogalacturonan acetylesterase [Bythopirellula goksoeyrii]|uniref:Putative rhamnogalacturonan acetylesterase YesY n=1 Tax=Bythopirellula goksoeyrii TaxID=1400387 RepID=A0A5B9Q8U9_9BACT|nr:rhamnogalacturonan acetylesterase [Bythopirellula goksoeyrii]QEG35417.1 putative rhamnogalacturonan acetylesterase YesY [Bythopirellula goksoeyrii]